MSPSANNAPANDACTRRRLLLCQNDWSPSRSRICDEPRDRHGVEDRRHAEDEHGGNRVDHQVAVELARQSVERGNQRLASQSDQLLQDREAERRGDVMDELHAHVCWLDQFRPSYAAAPVGAKIQEWQISHSRREIEFHDSRRCRHRPRFAGETKLAGPRHAQTHGARIRAVKRQGEVGRGDPLAVVRPAPGQIRRRNKAHPARWRHRSAASAKIPDAGGSRARGCRLPPDTGRDQRSPPNSRPPRSRVRPSRLARSTTLMPNQQSPRMRIGRGGAGANRSCS